jgi:hypothetical protein
MKLRSTLAVVFLVGCGTDSALPPLAPPPVDVEVQVEQTVVPSGEPIVVEVTTWTSTDWTLPPVAPVAKDLQTVGTGVDGPSVVGDRTRTVSTFELSGDDGSYIVVVPPVDATGPGDQTRTIEPPPVFVDIGTTPPALNGLVDAEAIPEEEPLPIGWLLAGGSVAVFAVGFLIAAIVVSVRSKPPERPKPAEVVAREAWATARRDETDDHALALALSQIFRRYIQAVTGYSMLSRTTREIVQILHSEDLLSDELRPRVQRVLDATDRLKFAREGGGAEFFDELEADFLAVVSALSRPVAEEGSDA